jgi:hypothetical protein
MSNKPNCDCLNECGDDPDICRKKVNPCQQHVKHLEHIRHRQIDQEIESLRLGEKLTDHVIGKAAEVMVHAHKRTETMVEAINEVHSQFPELAFRHLALLWIGINVGYWAS